MPSIDENQTYERKNGAFQHYTHIIPISEAEASYIPVQDVIKRRKVHTWVRTPNFRNIEPRNRPNNPRSLKYMNWAGVLRHLSIDSYGYYNLVYSNPFLSFPRTTDLWPAPQEVVQKSVSKIASKAQGAKVNLGQMMAERKQTVNLVATTASRLAQAYSSLRKGNLSHAYKALSLQRTPPKKVLDDYKFRHPKSPDLAASSLWLEIQYGWKPLLSDIYNSCELLAEGVVARHPICEVRGASKEKIITVNPLGSRADGGGWVGIQTEEYAAMTTVQYTFSDEMATVLSKTGVSNPALLAWELVPYSFVVDWFLPVGNYLESFTAYDGLAFRSGYQVTRTLSKASCQPASQRWSKSNVSYEEDGRFSFEGSNYQRTPLYGFPSVNFPTLKNPFSPSHLTSALSLLTQAFRR